MTRKGKSGRPWTLEQVDEMLRLRRSHTVASISKIVGRSERSVSAKLQAVVAGRRTTRKYHEWSGEDIETLRGMWPSHSCIEIASRVGLTPKSVQRKAERLGLRKPVAYLMTHTTSAYLAYPKELRDCIQLAKQIREKINERKDDCQPA